MGLSRSDIERLSRLQVKNLMCERNNVFLMGQIAEKEQFAATLTHEFFHRFYQDRIAKLWEQVSANDVKIRCNHQEIEEIEDRLRRQNADRLARSIRTESELHEYAQCSAPLAASCKSASTAHRQPAISPSVPRQSHVGYALEPESVPSRHVMVPSPGGQVTMFGCDDDDETVDADDEAPAQVLANKTHVAATSESVSAAPAISAPSTESATVTPPAPESAEVAAKGTEFSEEFGEELDGNGAVENVDSAPAPESDSAVAQTLSRVVKRARGLALRNKKRRGKKRRQ